MFSRLQKAYMALGPWIGVEWTTAGPRFLWDAGAQTVSGISVNGDSALKTIAVQRCVSLIAGTLAKTPIYSYSPGTRRVIRQSPLDAIFNRAANPSLSGFAYRSYAWKEILLWGNHYALKIRRSNSGQLIGLIPLRAAQVERKIKEDGITPYYRLHKVDGLYSDYQAADIFHVPYLVTDQYGCGLSVIEAGAQEIGLNQAAQMDAASWFQRGARPSGVLKHPGKLNDEPYRRLQEAWQKQQGGLDNAHKIAILEEGMEFLPMSTTPAAKQLLESRIQSDEHVCMIFGVPPSMIGLTSKSTSWGSGIAEQVLGWQKFNLGPLSSQFESQAQMQLVTDSSELRHDFSELLTPSFDKLVEALGNAHRGGLLTANECRERIDYDPMQGGDNLLVQQQMIPITRAGDQLAAGGLDAPNPTI